MFTHHLFIRQYFFFILKGEMSSTTATPTSSSDAALQQQQSKQRKTLVSKILKRSSSMQTPANDQKQSSTVGSTVTFNINKNNTLDKAGAYGIQGFFSAYISNINGCFYNVMGLPISLLYKEYKKMKNLIK